MTPVFSRPGLDLDEIAHLDLLVELGARPQPRKRADLAATAGDHAIDDAVSVHRAVVTEPAVRDDGVGADADPVPERHIAAENRAHIDEHVPAHGQPAAKVEAGWVGERDTPVQQLPGIALLDGALGQSQLPTVVDANRLCRVGHRHAAYRHTIGHRHGDHVGEVKLTLGVGAVQAVQPAPGRLGTQHHDARVDFLDGELFRRGICVLDHRHDGPRIVAQNAAVAGWIID